MSIKSSFKTGLVLSLILFTAVIFAQDKNGTHQMKMDGHMKMHQGQMNKSDDSAIDVAAIDKNNDGKIYQCPMDFDVLSDKPGKDPKCGMDLEEVTLDQAKENLVKNGFKVKEESIVREGTIDLNKIDENKDGKVYEDMMDYNVVADNPGTCPLCGMKLKEVTIEEAKTNLVKNGFKVSENFDIENHSNVKELTWNKYCPVSGAKVNPNATSVLYDGKNIGFCCPHAEHNKTFLKDPEKYLKNLSKDGQEFIGNRS